MQRFARWVLGYHGCAKAFAAKLVGGDLTIDEWAPSAVRDRRCILGIVRPT